MAFSKVIVGNVAVNRWLPGSIDLFTPEFFKEIKDLPPGKSTTFQTRSPCLPTFLLGNTRFPLPSWTHSSAPVVRLGIKGRGTTAGIC